MTWFDLESDQAFGPQFRDKFDFTLEFEHTILSVLPASLFLAGVPIFFFLYHHRPNIVLSGKLLWVKLATTIALIGVEIASLSLWSNSSQRATGSAIAAATLLVASALCLAPMIYWEHRRTLQSTSFVAIWLIISALCDIVRSRSCFLRPGLNDIGILTVVTAALKIFTLGLEEISKASLIADEATRQDAGKEATSGFLSRTFFVWINKMFFFGFKNILRLDTLDSLGPAFRSQYLSDHLNLFWNAYNGSVSGSLELACVRANLGPWLSAAFPRLCQGIFTVAQPLLLKSVVTYVESDEKTTGRRDGLIIAAAFIYGGLALSKLSYDHICYRIATQIRGMLVAQTSKKALKLKYLEAQNTANITLMNVDMKNIATAIPRIHHMWASVLQTAANLYILTGIVNEATVLVVGPIILSIVGSYYVGKNMPSAQKLWTAAISTRVAKTSKMITQIKAVKMTGLEDVMANYVQGLREIEVEHSKRTRIWLVRNYVIGTFCDCITSPVVLAGGIFWTGLGGEFTPSNVFTALATVTLIGSTLKYLPDEYGYIQTARGALERFEQYLALEERQDPRYTDLVAFSAEVARSQAKDNVIRETKIIAPEVVQPASRVIEFYNAEIAVEGTDESVLENVNIAIERRELVMVVGPTGGGKSTLLRGILGEIELMGGSLYVEAGYIAYCDQTAWIWNASIQVNIIGNSPVDMGWYDAVLDACLLKPDLRRLPHGDQTSVGSNGGNLSGGQKQRVALARAVHTRSPILVIDDILSTLDRRTAAEIFSRLFGPNGLLKKTMTTVVMATHSIQFLSAADRVLLVSKDGNVTTRTDVEEFVRTEEIQEICNKISAANTEKDKEEPAGEEAFEFRAPIPAVMDDDIARQKGDLTIYLFYSRSFQLFHAVSWLIFMLMTAAGEVLSDGYVRIWMELDPNNRLWYIGYVLIGSSAAFFMMINTRTLFLKLLPYSSLYLHRMLLDVLMRARLSFLTGTDHGSLVNRISQDLTMVSQQLPEGGMRVLYYCFRMLLRIGMIIAVTSYTVAILPFLIAAMYVIQLFYLRTSRQLRYLELETGAPLCAQFTESAAGLYHIRAFGWQLNSLEAALGLLDDSQKPFYYMYAAERWLGLIMDTITLIMALTVIIITLCVQEITSASGIALSMLSLITLSFESMHFVRQWMLVETSIGALARTRDFVQNTPLEEDPDVITETAESWPQKGAIVMQHVVARYGPEDTAPAVLDGVSLDIAPKARVGIVGRTGGGKSSILMTLLGFLDYTGVIAIDNVDISRIPRKKLRSIVTAISQDDLEFDGTVRYNLCPNPNDENAKMPFNEAALLVLLDRLQLLDLLDKQNPLDTQMSTLGLSHGQKQLMSIARSCVRNYTFDTRIIIMDEATSNLDPVNEEFVLQVFRELFNDCTVLMVAHRTETLDNADMIVEIADGRVASTRYPKQESPATPNYEGMHGQRAGVPRTAGMYGRMPAVPSLPSTLRAYPGATGGTSSSVSSARESSHTPTQQSISSPAQQQTPQRPTAPVPMNPFFERLLCMSERNVEIGRQFNENRRIALGQKVVSQVDRLREKARIEAEEEENARAKAAAKIAQKREIEEARKLRKAEKAERKAKGKARAGKDAPMTEKGAGEGRAPSTEVFEEKDKQDVEEHGEKDQREMEEGNEEKRKEKGQ